MAALKLLCIAVLGLAATSVNTNTVSTKAGASAGNKHMSIATAAEQSNSNKKICGLCGKAAPELRCSRCKCVSYCSKQHQAEHWPTHKVNSIMLKSTFICAIYFNIKVHDRR